MMSEGKIELLPNNSFEYGGFHFVPIRKINEKENSDICTFMRNVKTDVKLGFFRRDDIPGRKQKYPYSYEKFYEAFAMKTVRFLLIKK